MGVVHFLGVNDRKSNEGVAGEEVAHSFAVHDQKSKVAGEGVVLGCMLEGLETWAGVESAAA